MRIQRFDIIWVRADIADVRKGEIDDLSGIARVGHHFLIAGHRGVEAHLAHGCAFCAKAMSPQYRAVRQRSEEHTSELQSLMRLSYAVFCLKKKTNSQPLLVTNS